MNSFLVAVCSCKESSNQTADDCDINTIAIYVGVLVVIISIIALFEMTIENKQIIKKLSKTIHKDDDRNIQPTFPLAPSDSRITKLSSEIIELRNKNIKLEAEISSIKNYITTASQKKKTISNTPKTIYLVANVGNKFIKEVPNYDEASAYKARYITDNEIEFEPISWQKIKMSPSYSNAVVTHGDPSKAKTMTVNKPGKALQLSGGKNISWLITEKCDIKLS